MWQWIATSKKILIDGHADDGSSRLADLVLSKDRVENVVAALVELGVKRQMIEARHHGNRQPYSKEQSEVIVEYGFDWSKRYEDRVLKNYSVVGCKGLVSTQTAQLMEQEGLISLKGSAAGWRWSMFLPAAPSR